LSDDTVKNLPTTLHKLKLIGDQYLNLDVANVSILIFLDVFAVFKGSGCQLVHNGASLVGLVSLAMLQFKNGDELVETGH
jgi:hypothetical protein